MGAYHATAAVLSVGDELTLGQTLDTNSRWISTRLSELGVAVLEHATVPDDGPAQRGAIERLAARVDLLVCSGGLGPTSDDLTRQALASAMGETLVVDEAALGQIRAWFAGRGAMMPEANAVQALRPASGRSLPNDRGTAPGIAARVGACDVVCLPGPPRELHPMFEREVPAMLRPAPGRVIRTRTLPTFGMGESAVAAALGPLMDRARATLVGTTASEGIVTCRLRYEGPGTPELAEGLLDETEREVRALLGPAVLRTGGGSESLVEVVAALLTQHKATVCTVESCTGGLLGAALTGVAGSSGFFAGGLLTYSNALKASLAGVDPAVIEREGAVSGAVALAMARGGLGRTGAGHALAITGIAGPGGGSEAKPVGTVWIAHLEGASGRVDLRRFRFGGDRGAVRAAACRSALGMLRLRLLGASMTLLGEQERSDGVGL